MMWGILGGRDRLEEETDEVVERAEQLGTILDQPGENAVKQWLILHANRLVVTVILMLIVFALLVILSAIRPRSVYQLLVETDTVRTLFNTLLSGIILLVSIVVSINSVVISEELTPVGSQQERISETIEFRQDTEQLTDTDVAPPRPSNFLYLLLSTIDDRAINLRDSVTDSQDGKVENQVDTYVNHVTGYTDKLGAVLETSEFGTSDILLAGLSYDYSWQIYAARRIQAEHEHALTEAQRQSFTELVDVLQHFATAHEYFKTLYFKREFAQLSSTLLYVALPAIIVTSYVILAVDAGQFPELFVFGVSPLVVFVSAAFAIALAPYLLLTAFVIRAATVALRTLATGPFIVSQSAIDRPIDWEN